jgi:hypothetical protein
VAIGATAATDYLFSSFSGAMNTITNPQSLNITAPATVTASFQPDFTLSTSTGTASAGAGGTSTSYTVTVSASSSFNSIVNFDKRGCVAIHCSIQRPAGRHGVDPESADHTLCSE